MAIGDGHQRSVDAATTTVAFRYSGIASACDSLVAKGVVRHLGQLTIGFVRQAVVPDRRWVCTASSARRPRHDPVTC